MSSNIKTIYVAIGRGQGKNQIREVFERLAEERSKHLNNAVYDEHSFTMANVQLTDVQKEAINKLSAVFGEFSERMMSNIMGLMTPVKGSLSVLQNLQETIYPPQMDYTQKHKPWKKDKFYY